jgi:hypothetical protein
VLHGSYKRLRRSTIVGSVLLQRQLGQRLRDNSKPIDWVMGPLGWLVIAACHVQRCGWECCHTPSCIAWCGTWCVWQALVLLNLDAKLHGQLLLKHLLCLC